MSFSKVWSKPDTECIYFVSIYISHLSMDHECYTIPIPFLVLSFFKDGGISMKITLSLYSSIISYFMYHSVYHTLYLLPYLSHPCAPHDPHPPPLTQLCHQNLSGRRHHSAGNPSVDFLPFLGRNTCWRLKSPSLLSFTSSHSLF